VPSAFSGGVLRVFLRTSRHWLASGLDFCPVGPRMILLLLLQRRLIACGFFFTCPSLRFGVSSFRFSELFVRSTPVFKHYKCGVRIHPSSFYTSIFPPSPGLLLPRHGPVVFFRSSPCPGIRFGDNRSRLPFPYHGLSVFIHAGSSRSPASVLPTPGLCRWLL